MSDNATVVDTIEVESGQAITQLPTVADTVNSKFLKWVTVPYGNEEVDLSSIISDLEVYAKVETTVIIVLNFANDYPNLVVIDSGTNNLIVEPVITTSNEGYPIYTYTKVFDDKGSAHTILTASAEGYDNLEVVNAWLKTNQTKTVELLPEAEEGSSG